MEVMGHPSLQLRSLFGVGAGQVSLVGLGQSVLTLAKVMLLVLQTAGALTLQFCSRVQLDRAGELTLGSLKDM